MNEQVPLPYKVAIPALLRCVARTAVLLARHRIHLSREHLGMILRFADGTKARVYRETVVDGTPRDPCTLVVEFQLWSWAVRGTRTHALFRWESLLNTPLFIGFPGFVSKLWLANDEHGIYRGIYEWDGPARAEFYARCLWRVLALGCEPGSIHYHVVPGMRRDTLVAAPASAQIGSSEIAAWWRPIRAA